MSDLIDRQFVLKDLEEYILNAEDVTAEHPDDVRYYNSGLRTAIQAVTDAPSAQPQKKKGRWMMNTGLGTMCSNCYYKLETTGLLSYCPNCGAYMET